ncbi:MAG: cytochrome c [Prolixibacteraceae bacterium]|nr:cytochrome c [Prolixibacteraceae bacterium]
MKKQSAILWTMFSLLLIFVLSASKPQVEGQKIGGKWDVPAEYKAMKNTFASDKSLVDIGKMHYTKHCRSCHGNTGLGDGPKAKNLKTFPGKFNDPKFQAQTDGELYYQSIIGRDEMPNYEAKIPEMEDRWALIMYIRTLK